MNYFSVSILLICTASCWALIASANAIVNSEQKPLYFLKCVEGSTECTMIESGVPKFELELAENAEKEFEGASGLEMDKRSSDYPSSRFQSLIKRFFKTEPTKVFKTNEINCLTDDCRVLTAKISKRNRSGPGTLACVGDPYSNLGSRCVPIEGLYIGKK